MKKMIFMGLVLTTLTACSTTEQKNTSSAKVGIANPASEHCLAQGGRLDIKNEANGQVGYCTLANGQVVEEWALFRASQPKCLPEQAQTLIGQSALSDEQIKHISKAEIVRRIAPNQPMTMDYRENRVTIMLEPVSEKITNATCG
ncbi:MAG: DUF333 domain-containing protein [Acinetobacter sp.]|jgi:putative hemolysin|nr:MAG: DUF333 domain-containing protein [Acinetobacter sp.]